MTQNPNKKALDEEAVIAVTEELGAAGVVTYWKIAGETNQAVFEQAWKEMNLEQHGKVPACPSAEVAFTRALAEFDKGNMRVERRAKRMEGFEIVKVITTAGEPNRYERITTVKLSELKTVQFTDTHWRHDEIEGQVRKSYMHHLEVLSGSDISDFLKGLVFKLNGVTLRESGGVYFIDSVYVDLWSSMVAAISRAGGHRVYRIPAMRGSQAVEAVLDALREEAEQEITSLFAELNETDEEKKLGSRALRSRVETTKAKARKVAHYEKLLGVALPDLQEKLEGLKATLAATAIQVESEEQARREAAKK